MYNMRFYKETVSEHYWNWYVDDAVCASCKEDDEYCENKCNLTIEIRQRILAK